jgi:hypothetical protein
LFEEICAENRHKSLIVQCLVPNIPSSI